MEIAESIARHAANDIKDFRTSETASSCSYTPYDKGGIINAAAYRAFLLTSALKVLSDDELWKTAERSLNFLRAQNRLSLTGDPERRRPVRRTTTP